MHRETRERRAEGAAASSDSGRGVQPFCRRRQRERRSQRDLTVEVRPCPKDTVAQSRGGGHGGKRRTRSAASSTRCHRRGQGRDYVGPRTRRRYQTATSLRQRRRVPRGDREGDGAHRADADAMRAGRGMTRYANAATHREKDARSSALTLYGDEGNQAPARPAGAVRAAASLVLFNDDEDAGGGDADGGGGGGAACLTWRTRTRGGAGASRGETSSTSSRRTVQTRRPRETS